MRKIWYLCSDLCDMPRKICWSNKISKRWSSHRCNWNRPDCEIDKNDKDKVALSRHYSVFHGNLNKPAIHEAYTVTYVEQPSFQSLNISKDKWYHKLNAQINIQNMILPAWDKFCLLSYLALMCFIFHRHCAGVLVLVSHSVSVTSAEIWLPSLQNARWAWAFCSYSKSYGMLFHAIQLLDVSPCQFSCIYLKTTYSIHRIVAGVGIYKVRAIFAVSFEASLNACGWLRRNF